MGNHLSPQFMRLFGNGLQMVGGQFGVDLGQIVLFAACSIASNDAPGHIGAVQYRAERGADLAIPDQSPKQGMTGGEDARTLHTPISDEIPLG